MSQVRIVALGVLLLVLPLHCSSDLPNVLQFGKDSLEHVIQKRFESTHDTDFMQTTITVEENVGVLVDTLCVKGGPNKRFFRLFSAGGPQGRCSGGPCPIATENVDYEVVYVDMFRPHPGELVCFNVTILNDGLVEGREFFLIGLLDLRWGEVLSTASITILDDESPRLTSDFRIVAESVGVVEFCLTGGNATDLPVEFLVDDPDLVAKREIFVISSGQMVCLNFTVLDDELLEGFENAQVVVRSANTSIGNFSEYFTVHILDNDETPQFEQRSYTVSEGDGNVTVCAVFTTDSTITVTSSLSAVDGSARSGIDYIAPSRTFSLMNGQRECVVIDIIDDDNEERTETFTMILTSSNVEVNQPVQVSVTVLDNDVISFEQSVYTITEGAGGIDVCVILPGQGSVKRGVIETKPGTAQKKVDFVPLRRRAFNISGSERRCFSIFTPVDSVPEHREEFTVQVYTLLDDLTIAVDVRTAQIVIEDDDSSECANLTAPQNGDILAFTDENNPGSQVIYSCNSGFRLTGLGGSDRRTCMPTGEWTGRDPSCVAITCPALNSPPNGRVTVSGQTFLSTATYTCNNGFQLDGNMERVCTSRFGGSWTGTAPVCRLIVCPFLPSPANGTVVLPEPRIPGSVAQYSCMEGLVLDGSAMRLCLDNGTWNDTAPTCMLSALILRQPLDLKLVNDTPKIDGTTVSVQINVTGPVNKVTCSLDKKKTVVEDFTGRTKGGMNFTDVAPGGHTLDVLVSSLVSEERAYVSRFFEIGSTKSFCGLHLINEGYLIHSHRLKVEFAAVPEAKYYRCKLDRLPGFNCISPVEMSGLKPGHHRLKIMHNRDECGDRRKLFIHFDIENTPDNPYNNI